MPLSAPNKLYFAREWFKEKKARNEAENAVLSEVIATLDQVDAGQEDLTVAVPKADKLQAVYELCEKERQAIKVWAQTLAAQSQE